MSEQAEYVADANAYFTVKNLKAYYGDSYIVQDVSLDVAEGQIVALLGRNGAGKTSMPFRGNLSQWRVLAR